MKWILTSLGVLLWLLLGTSCTAAAGGGGLELVMSKGDKVIATTTAGKVEILAGNGLTRSYTWEGATRSAKLLPRTKRWYGSMGAYYPGPGEHWKNHNGITRGVLNEGRQDFETQEAAQKWLAQRREWYPTVHTNSGLVVSFGKVAERRQINVDVWQITINGKAPTKLEGSSDKSVTLVQAKATNEKNQGAALPSRGS